jgi:hypothetical protein
VALDQRSFGVTVAELCAPEQEFLTNRTTPTRTLAGRWRNQWRAPVALVAAERLAASRSSVASPLDRDARDHQRGTLDAHYPAIRALDGLGSPVEGAWVQED